MKIEMGIGWVPSKTSPGHVQSATPGEYAAEIERLREALEKLDIMISDWAKDEGFPRENSACWGLVRATLNPNS